MIIKGFTEWVNESEHDPIRRLEGLAYLHSSGSLDTDEYSREAGKLLTDLDKIQSNPEVKCSVDDQDEPNINHWLNWAQGWHGQGMEQISSITGSIDSVGAGEFNIKLNTGLTCKVTLTQEEMREYKMIVEVQVGSQSFRMVVKDLMSNGMEWGDTTDLLARVLEWAVNKYGHLALDLLIRQLV
jgi:hypothetical protein